VMDTAAWLRDWLHGQLVGFGLNMLGLRLLEMLYRKGPMEMLEAAEERGCRLQHLHRLVSHLAKHGWVRRDVMRRFPAEIRLTRIPIARRNKERQGRRVSVVRLTPLGRKLVETVLPKHEKVVKALMRALDGREQETLSMLCRKLRDFDVMRFLSELTHWRAGE
jgi:DNA-binding MarR family transcriptional regulator